MPDVPEGVVVGGWSFVIAAYSITAVVLTALGLSLVMRYKRASEREEMNHDK